MGLLKMKVKVRLHGTLRQNFPDYGSSQGFEIEIPDGTMVENLLTLLDISEPKGAAAIVNGRVLKADDEIQDGVSVDIFQIIQGG